MFRVIFSILLLGSAWTNSLAAGPTAQSRSGASSWLTIPAQPLEDALDRYAAATGLQMLYDASLASGRRSSAVTGATDARTGLALLLRGTGLSGRFTDGGAVVIYADTPAVILNPIMAVAPPTIGRSGPDAAALAYVERVQADLVQLIRANESLSADDYRVSVAVWITDEGTIGRAEILSAVGRSELLQGLTGALVGARLSGPPPEGLPQPLRIELVVSQPNRR